MNSKINLKLELFILTVLGSIALFFVLILG